MRARALREASGELDRKAAKARRHVQRHAMIATLTFAGRRIGELLAPCWKDVDLAGDWLTVNRTKTSEAVRKIKIRPARFRRKGELSHDARAGQGASCIVVSPERSDGSGRALLKIAASDRFRARFLGALQPGVGGRIRRFASFPDKDHCRYKDDRKGERHVHLSQCSADHDAPQ